MPMVQMAQTVQKVLLYQKDQMAQKVLLIQKAQKVLLIQKAQKVLLIQKAQKVLLDRTDLCHRPTLHSETLSSPH
jgi:hypothetical protein